jgi:hypothetical protein
MLESLGSNGTGVVRFDMTRVVPGSEMQMLTKTSLRADKDGQSQRIATQVQLGVTIRATP